MSQEWDEKRLREAFAALADIEEGGDVDAERVWLAVTGELPPEERREVVDQVATNPAYAEAWRVATELWRASREGAPNVVAIEGRRRSWTRRLPHVVAAAAALLAVAVGLFVREAVAPSREPVFRDPEARSIESRVPADGRLPRDDFRLRWSEVSEDARYEVRVTTEELRVLASVSGLEDNEFVVPEERLRDLSAGSKILWQVEATLPDGSVVSSETFISEVS